MPDTCKTCGKPMDNRDNCGGDCVFCMAEAGDPECIKACITRARNAQEEITQLLDRIHDRTMAFEAKDGRQVRRIVELETQLDIATRKLR